MKIGLVLGTLNDDYNNQIAELITDKILSLNAQFVLFECSDIDNNTPADTVNSALLRILNFEDLDGIIIAPSTFLNDNIGSFISELAKKVSKPIVSLGLPIEGVPSVILDYTSAFENIISLLIKHDINSFAFISGPLSRPVFSLRYEAFLDAISKKGLEVPPSLRLEGTGGYMSGYNCARKLAPFIKNGSVKAVICAGDDIALSAIKYFTENNINVPADVKVTGFGSTENDFFPIPYLTTINRHLELAFQKSISILFEQISGNNSKLTYCLTPELITGLSCGCDKKEPVKFDLRFSWTMFHGLRGIPNTSEPEGIISKITRYLVDNNVSQCYIVKYCTPIVPAKLADNYEKHEGTLFYGFSHDKVVTYSKSFSTIDILPSHLINKISEPMLYKPLFVNNKIYGFLYISVSNYFAPLINDLSNELCQYFSDFYFRQELERFEKTNADVRDSLIISNKRLNELTVKDNLDKLVNVRFLASNMRQKRQGITGEYILIIAEIDNYYEINENFGFSEGEYVISCVSNILAGSIRDDDYLSHQSFERYIILVKNIQSNPILTIGERFTKALKELNQSINKPYDISFCWGYASTNLEIDLDTAYTKAEQNLSEVKQSRMIKL